MDALEMTLRLFISLAVGGVIGMQREMVRSSAGFRTHTLVCIGACLAMLTDQFLLARYHTMGNMDVARMGSYVLGGIGFLGAGTIFRDGLRVRGLTTAASLWVVAAIGLAVGAGFYLGALLAGVMTVVTLWVLKFIEDKSFFRPNSAWLELEMQNSPGRLASVLVPLVELGCSILDIRMEPGEEEWVGVALRLKMPRGIDMRKVREKLGGVGGIRT